MLPALSWFRRWQFSPAFLSWLRREWGGRNFPLDDPEKTTLAEVLACVAVRGWQASQAISPTDWSRVLMVLKDKIHKWAEDGKPQKGVSWLICILDQRYLVCGGENRVYDLQESQWTTVGPRQSFCSQAINLAAGWQTLIPRNSDDKSAASNTTNNVGQARTPGNSE